MVRSIFMMFLKVAIQASKELKHKDKKLHIYSP